MIPPLPRKPPKNVGRVDHHYFHGYVVCVVRQRKAYERYFPDEGGRERTLRRAIRFRDELLLTLPPPRRFHTRSRVSKTGVVGVILRRERTRGGRPVRFFTALWSDEAGLKRSRTFSVQKYGKDRAFAFAVDARKQALEVLLRPKQPRATPLLEPRPWTR